MSESYSILYMSDNIMYKIRNYMITWRKNLQLLLLEDVCNLVEVIKTLQIIKKTNVNEIIKLTIY